MELMVERDGSRESVVRKKSMHTSAPRSVTYTVPRPPDPSIPHPPTTTTYSPFPLPGIPPSASPPPPPPPPPSSSPTTTSTSSSEISSGVEGMKITVDTTDSTINDKRDEHRTTANSAGETKEDEYELVHEGSYLRAMLDADTPVETMATYAASKNKLHGADEVYSRIMSLGDGDSDDEED